MTPSLDTPSGVVLGRHMQYLRGCNSVCLQFGRIRDGVVGYVDSDYIGDLNKRISLTGYVFTIRGCAIS